MNNSNNNNLPLLVINELTVTANNSLPKELVEQKSANKIILENLNLTIFPGEIHAIMGPNGAGKSTLAHVLLKNPDYKIIKGYIKFLTHDLASYTPQECAQQGIFLSFQNPIAIPGISTMQFLKASLNSIKKSRGEKPLDTMSFLTLVRQKIKQLQIEEEFLHRAINNDFSGGEKKRNEILQMLLLEPKLIILDEIDSGLDIDSLQLIANCVKSMFSPKIAILLITHYQRILQYIQPDHVHILINKKISISGNKQLAEELEINGYNKFA